MEEEMEDVFPVWVKLSRQIGEKMIISQEIIINKVYEMNLPHCLKGLYGVWEF